MRKRNLFTLIVSLAFVFGFVLQGNGQCPNAKLTAKKYKGCVPANLDFELTGAPQFDHLKWDWKDNKTTQDNNLKQTHRFDTAGSFNPSVTLYDKDSNVICKVIIDQLIRVFDLPNARMILPDSTTQCFNGNNFQLQDNSRRSDDNAPITRHFWTFGDGDTSDKQNPLKHYTSSGKFTVKLQVSDANGCTDIEVRRTVIHVLPELIPKFKTKFSLACPETPVEFTNNTSTKLKNIQDFWWDFGDNRYYDFNPDTLISGTDTSLVIRSLVRKRTTDTIRDVIGNCKKRLTMDTVKKLYIDTFGIDTVPIDTFHKYLFKVDPLWKNFILPYRQDGQFNPKLYIAGRYGGKLCVDSSTGFAAAKNINYKFEITVDPDSIICWENPVVQFNQPERQFSTYHFWTFDDPPSGPQNFDDESWNPGHRYAGGPGNYDVYLKIFEPGCVRDTLMKDIVKIAGPAANIQTLPPPPVSPIPANNCVEAEDQPISKSYFLDFQRQGCKGMDTSIQYVQIDTISKPYNVEVADTIWCGPEVASVMKRMDSVVVTQGSPKIWNVGDPIPENAYFPTVGTCPQQNQLSVHDTDLYEPNCGDTNWVRFTNNTIKFRYVQKFNFMMDTSWDYTYTGAGLDSTAKTPLFLEVYQGGDTICQRVWPPYYTYTFDPLTGNKLDSTLVPYDSTMVYEPGEYFKVRDTAGTPVFSHPNDAVDNFPPGQNPAYFFGTWDSCVNPSVPWGSDSLRYLWDFGDIEGEACTVRTVMGSRNSRVWPDHRMVYNGTNDSFVIDQLMNNPNRPDIPFDYVVSGRVRVYASTRRDFTKEISRSNFKINNAQDAYLVWNTGYTPPSDTLYIDYAGHLSQKAAEDSAKCNRSTARVPWHRYDSAGCFSVTLRAIDPVNGCESEANATIMMMEPDAGWGEEFYLRDQNKATYYTGQDSLFLDSLLQKSNDPNIRILGKGLQVFDQNNNLLEKDSFNYYVSNHNTAWLVFQPNDKPASNQFLTIRYTARKPAYLFGDTLEIKNMTYDIQNLLPAWQTVTGSRGQDSSITARRGFRITGTPCVGLRYRQRLRFRELLPAAQCGSPGLDYGVIIDSAAQVVADSVPCVDSVFIDTDGDGIKETFDHVERDTILEHAWDPMMSIESPFWYPPTPPRQFYYPTPGCKTVGIWLRTAPRGCIDTFWYHNYKYIADLRPFFYLLDPNTGDPLTSADDYKNSFCVPDSGRGAIDFKGYPIVRPQENISKFRFNATRIYPGPNVVYKDSLTQIKDTTYRFCDTFEVEFNQYTNQYDTNWVDCILFPPVGCGDNPFSDVSINKLKKEFYLADKTPVLTLMDTAENITVKKPGVYNFVSTIRNVNGCTGNSLRQVHVGHYADYRADVWEKDNDTVVCIGDTVFFWDRYGVANRELFNTWFPRYWDPHPDPLNPARIIYVNETNFFKDPQGARDWCVFNCTPPHAPNFQYEEIKYDLNDDGYYETRYNINTFVFESDLDKNGSFETKLETRDVNDDGIKDTVPYYVYQEEGIYDISMLSVDSTQCAQILKREEYINVTGVSAFADTLVAPSVCPPQTVRFVDSSISRHAYNYTYDTAGNKIDSARLDSIVTRKWTIYKEQPGDDSLVFKSFLNNPTYVFVNSGDYRVELKVNNTVGCVDSTNDPKYAGDPDKDLKIPIIGPKPEFVILNNDSCTPHKVRVKDLSEGVSIWTFDLGNGDIQSFSNLPKDSIFTFTYTKPGTYYMTMIGSDSIPTGTGDTVDCSVDYPLLKPGDTITNYKHLKVTVFPTDKVGFNVSDDLVCPGTDIVFTSKSDSDYTEFTWFFGDGDTVTTGNPVTIHSFDAPKDTTYRIVLAPSGDSVKCRDTSDFTVEVRGVKSKFDSIPSDNPRSKDPVYRFRNQSVNGEKFEWKIYNDTIDHVAAIASKTTTDYDEVFEHDFGVNQGFFDVCLITENDIGCLDTFCMVVENRFDTLFERTNLFTPNGDGKNDKFSLELRGEVEFDLTIYNRWGEKVYKTNHEEYQPDCEVTRNNQGDIKRRYCRFWNGNVMNSGSECSAGTYYYIFNYHLRGGKTQTQTGTVTLVR